MPICREYRACVAQASRESENIAVPRIERRHRDAISGVLYQRARAALEALGYISLVSWRVVHFDARDEKFGDAISCLIITSIVHSAVNSRSRYRDGVGRISRARLPAERIFEFWTHSRFTDKPDAMKCRNPGAVELRDV